MMPDKLNTLLRSRTMSRVRSKDTGPELRVRKVLHRLGYRYRLHKKELPGKPDIVLSKYRLCIFVHGCFWHRHPGCNRSSLPKTNIDFWLEKFEKNVERDRLVHSQLESLGWRVEVVWECETKSTDVLSKRIKKIFQ